MAPSPIAARRIWLTGQFLTAAAVASLLFATGTVTARPPGGHGNGGGGGGGGGGEDPPANPAIVYLDRNDVYVMDADGANATRILRTRRDSVHRASWSPDGSQIVFAAVLDGVQGVYVMNADGSNVHLVIETTVINGASHPVWSPIEAPDGRHKIAYYDDGLADDRDLFLVNPDGTGLVNLTATPGFVEWYPTWSFDGSRIAAVRDYGELVVYELGLIDGAVAIVNETVIFSTEVGFGLENMILEPTWANTSDTLVFPIVTSTGYEDLMMFEMDTQTLTPLTDTPLASERYPTFSPDDARVAFARWYADDGIHVMEVITGVTTLINSQGTHPSWKRN